MRWTERTGTQEMYATKVFNTMHPEHCKVLATELRVLLMVDCPCVVKFYGVSWRPKLLRSSRGVSTLMREHTY